MLPKFSLFYADGSHYQLSDYNGQVLLIVNTASQCGLSKQMSDLEDLYQTYKDDGFSLLGFPSKQFKQEPLSNETMQLSCYKDFGVTFPLNEIIEVNGVNQDPLYQWLKQEAEGWLGADIRWNFTKFLLNRQGQVVKRYAPFVSPKKISKDIEDLL